MFANLTATGKNVQMNNLLSQFVVPPNIKGGSQTVGLGTTNPGARLKVVGTSMFDTIGVNTTTIKTDPSFSAGNFQIVGDRLALFDAQIRFDFARQSKIGFGTIGDTLNGSIDLRRAGENSISPWAFLPEMSTTVRNTKTTATGQSASGIGTGAVIYIQQQRESKYIYLMEILLQM